MTKRGHINSANWSDIQLIDYEISSRIQYIKRTTIDIIDFTYSRHTNLLNKYNNIETTFAHSLAFTCSIFFNKNKYKNMKNAPKIVVDFVDRNLRITF